MTGSGPVTTVAAEDGIAVLSVNSPPVNALGTAVRNGIAADVRRAGADPAVQAIVLICEGRTFFAGADISEFGKPPEGIALRDMIAVIESAQKPVVAAIHGTALGGGLETALGCHYRVAVPVRDRRVCPRSSSASCRERAAPSACRGSSASSGRSP